MDNLNLTPEERMKGLMRNVSYGDKTQVDPSFQSSQQTIETPVVEDVQIPKLQNLGVGEGMPDVENGGDLNDFTDWVKGFSGKYGISQQFGNKSNMYKSGSHPGLDIKTPTGTLIKSPVSGNIKEGYDPNGWGRYVQIQMPDGEVVQFSHLSDTSDLIKELNKMKNKVIQKGQVIGTTGGGLNDPKRGLSTGPHLDVSVRRGGKFINPLTMK